MSIRAVFFDLGGTLLIMRRDRIFHKVLSEQGIDVDQDRIHSAYVRSESWWLSFYGKKVMTPPETDEAYRALDARVFLALFPKSGPEEAERVSRIVRSRWPELEEEIPLELYPDAVPTLSKLKGDGYHLGLISNAPSGTGRVVELLGLNRFLASIVISADVGYSKPNPEIFRIALGEAGVNPAEAIHVGDLYEADVLGARSAGVMGLLIDRDGSQAGLDCPRMSSLSEIYPYLR